MSDAQLVREEAEELRRRRVHTPGGKGPVPGRVRRKEGLHGSEASAVVGLARHDYAYGLGVDGERRVVGRWHCLSGAR